MHTLGLSSTSEFCNITDITKCVFYWMIAEHVSPLIADNYMQNTNRTQKETGYYIQHLSMYISFRLQLELGMPNNIFVMTDCFSNYINYTKTQVQRPWSPHVYNLITQIIKLMHLQYSAVKAVHLVRQCKTLMSIPRYEENHHTMKINIQLRKQLM